ncbi:DDRGK domain-containing protein 1 [Patella vulgata]|uniref:DDRGK domain-containing protein 1 n=1 Tax=Patella vulgata TaxID=6465 RepID=UPI00217F3CFA|nr:DDRGK domain-containing protein 1 [Patella vulgata]
MAVVDPFTIYLVTAGIVAVIFLIVFIVNKFSSNDKKQGGEGGGPARRPVPVNVEGPPGVRRRARRPRMVVRDEPDELDDEEDVFADFAQPEKKVGAKKLKKLQDKADRKAAREAEFEDRQERKEKEAEEEAKRKKQEAIRKQEEAIEAEEEKKRKEEEEKKEYEEYLKMKEMFSVDEEGENEAEVDLNSQSLLQEFIQYIKDMKVVMLEDLAAHFKIKTQDCIQRVHDLQSSGELTGVVDDRGKFIYITMEELEDVAKYIRRNGRVSIRDLADSSNRLINLNPDNAATHKHMMETVSA